MAKKKEAEATDPFSSKSSEEDKNSSRKVNVFIFTGLGAILLLAVGFGIYFYMQYKKENNIANNVIASNITEEDLLTKQVGALVELPQGEQPQIATVTDITKLKNQPFFKNAKNGDKVLIYVQAHEAILYDPSVNKVINLGPIGAQTASSQSTAVDAAQTTPMPVKVAIDNGTLIVGYAKSVQQQLTSKMKYVNVVETGNASNNSYPRTLVVDLSGNDSAMAGQIAAFVHGSVSALPKGEVKPDNADILIILGKPAQ